MKSLSQRPDMKPIYLPQPLKELSPKQTYLHDTNLAYDIEIKGELERLLVDVSGWVKPGTLTVLMGVSGAGKLYC
jgi:ABC-type transport system involved in cytochrome bd biosynthesis fused ATPase/permease subunit